MNTKILLTTLLLSLTTTSGVFAQFAGGDGSSGNPYQIATATQLDEVRNHLSSHFILTADIDLNTAPYNTGSGWLPIGDNSSNDNTTRFTGSLNGDGHKITGLFIDRSSTNYVGLFGDIGSGGSISNLGVEGSSVTGSSYAGGLAGRNQGTISNSYATADVTTTASTSGGLVGILNDGSITGSYATGVVTGGSNGRAGGLVAWYLGAGPITNSYATGSVTSTNSNPQNLGGLVGDLANSSGNITNSYATGAVSNGGGLVGDNAGGTVTDSYWDTETSGQATSGGGTGLTTAEMKQQASFSGWDFASTWAIETGDFISYPYLQAVPQDPAPGRTAAPIFAGGDGSSGNPYQIATAAQLDEVRNYLSSHFILTADIDLDVAPYNTGSGWLPIGDNSTTDNTTRFAGSLNGDGHKITGLFIDRPSTNYVGLFGYIGSGGSISNLGVEGSSVTGNARNGGLSGYNFEGSITNSYAAITVFGNNLTGGLVGVNKTGTVTGSYATGDVEKTGTGFSGGTGGLLGQNSEGATVTNSYATGSVTGVGNLGGLVGVNLFGGTITTSYAAGDVTGTEVNIGGLVGANQDGSIENSYALGDVVTADDRAGGLVGFNADTANPGSSSITNSYSTGEVTGSTSATNIGGLAGRNTGTVTDSYWNTDTSGQTAGIGVDENSQTADGLTTDEMKQQTSFSGWNFTGIWGISEGFSFPYLQNTSHRIMLLSIGGGEGWRIMSSPIDGLTYEDMIGKLWTQGFPGSDYPSTDIANVYTWPNDQTGSDLTHWAALDNQIDPIPAGTGFLIQVYADDNFDGIVEVEEDFDKTIRLDGPVLTGNVSPPMNTTLNGWTLVGNPYSDPIDFSELNSIDSGLTGVAYVFDPNYSGSDGGNTNGNPGGWRSTDGTFGELTNGIIAPAQGFFVQNSGGSGSITFTEASQTTGGQFYGKKKELRDFVRLEVQGESGVNAAWIRFSEKGSYEQMSGDALELQHYTEQYTMLGAHKADGTILDIAHFPLPDEQTEIPLSMNATQSGTYTLSATEVDLPAGTQLYLHDQGTGETILIDEGVSYSFDLDIEQAAKDSPLALTSRPTGERGYIPACGDTGVCRPMPQPVQPSGRFKRTDGLGARFLITTSKTPTTEVPQQIALGQNYPNPFNPTTVITYQLPSSSPVHLEIFDLIGRQVATLIDGIVEAGEHHVNFNAGHLTSGVYLYRLKTDSKIITRKLTLIK